MSDRADFERDVRAWLATEGVASRGDMATDDIVSKAGRLRQAPQWLALIQEPPMRLSSRAVVGSSAVRLAYLLVVTITLALVTLGGVVAGASLLSGPKPTVPSCGEVSCPVGSMSQSRGWHAAVLLDDSRVLVVAGDDADNRSDGSLASAELWDPATGTFSETGSLAAGRRAPTATLLADGSVLVIGGVVDGGEILASVERWDPATGTFYPAAALAEPRAYHTATLLPDGSVLVIGGGDFDGTPRASAELWDPGRSSFSPAGMMAEARFLHSATLLPDGRVLVVGGNWPPRDTLASAEIWDPETKSFSPAGTLSEPHGSHTATLLSDGDVLIVGGTGANDADGWFLSSADVWDPSSMSFTATGPLVDVRSDHAATLLDDGSVLVLGGVDEFEQAMDSVERWDPASSSFGPAGSLAEARGGSTLAVLQDSRILLVGGTDAQYVQTLASAELYDPDAPWQAQASVSPSPMR